MADYRDLAAALGGGYGQDTGGITPDTLITLKGGKKATVSDLLGMIKEIGAGSLSNFESLLRGGVAQVPGAGGDLEGLARMGINKAFGAGGVNVSETPVLPTTTDILGMMPRMTTPRQETAGMEELGGFMTPATAKLAGKAIKATEGLPVGMSIKDVSKNIFEDTIKYHQKVPEIKTINVNNLKRMNSGEVADVSDEVAAKMDFSKPIQVSVFADGELRIVDGHHRVAAAKKLGIQSLPVELQAINAKGATLNKLAQEATYPQQAALDLAQQRAALPVEQGGLGLPANNTAADRAKAMGFDVEAYRGSTAKEISHTNPIWWTEDPSYANTYAAHIVRPPIGQPDPYSGNVMPLLVKIGNEKQFEKFNAGGVPLDPFSGFSSDIQTGLRRYPKNDLTGELGGKVWEAVSIPENVRSRFAAFDPFRKDVATATAMGVALPDLLAAEKQDKQNKLSKALTK